MQSAHVGEAPDYPRSNVYASMKFHRLWAADKTVSGQPSHNHGFIWSGYYELNSLRTNEPLLGEVAWGTLVWKQQLSRKVSIAIISP